MESIEKLREWAQKYGPMGSHDPLMFADMIEAEIERDYMRLPRDADGVPIQIGDSLYSDEIKSQFMCRGMSLTLQSDNRKWWTIECWFDGYSGTSEYVSAKSCTHYHPPTVEDVLREFGDWYAHTKGGCDEPGIVAEYAERVREVLRDE